MASVNRDFAIPTGLFTNKNMLDNSAMQIVQRSASVANITTTGYYTADRWIAAINTLGTWTNTVENDAPTGSGLRKSLKMLVTTADAAPAAGDYALVTQYLEGQNVQRIAKGTSSAQQLTVSFWVKSNVTGTYICRLIDSDNIRHVAASYTISAGATWERKIITFPADTTGLLDNDNNTSLMIQFWLAAGSNYTSGALATAWATETIANGAVGQSNLAATTNNYWQITGIQLETGPVATSFEFENYGTSLMKCQRYYAIWISSGMAYGRFAMGANLATTKGIYVLPTPVTMRTTPTAASFTYGDLGVAEPNAAVIAATSVIAQTDGLTPYSILVEATVASGLTLYRPSVLIANNSTAAYMAISADL